MINHKIAVCIVLVVVLGGDSQAENRMIIEYHQPAIIWDTEALPIGNGCMGGMVFGSVDSERIQFNEDTLWTGNDQERGAYQPFGDLLICLTDKPVLIPRYSRKRRAYLRDSYEYSMDGKPETEWTERFDIEHEPVIWEICFAKKTVVQSYSMTSGPTGKGGGMPQSWEFQGSNDGKDWTTLNEQSADDEIWTGTLQKISFECDNKQAFSLYRIFFQPRLEPTEEDKKRRWHPELLQIGEISVDGFLVEPFSNYRRMLDIEDSVHRVSYKSGGVTFCRECFFSYPAKVMVMRLSADKSAQYTGAILLRDAHGADSIVLGQRISFRGRLEENGLAYETQIHVLNEGGKLTAKRDRILFEGSNGLTLVMSMGTDYVPDIDRNWRGGDPHERITRRVDQAVARGYYQLLRDHISDYRELFSRVEFHIDAENNKKDIPTDERLEAYKQGASDPRLEMLLFQVGRYLLISSSRPGCLPANLQGLWNNKWNPTWGSDYHSNINIQMSYWPAQTANLHELHMQYINYILSQIPGYRQRLKEAFLRAWRKTKGQKFFFGKNAHNILKINRL